MLLEGMRVGGGGHAAWTFKMQKMFFIFAKHFHDGTINLILKEPVAFKKYDVVTPRIDWDKSRTNPPEYFKFIKAKIIVNEQCVNCYIYEPQNSWHREHKDHMEIIAPWIDLGDAVDVKVEVPVDYVEVAK
jgi:CTP-dependent riboflavin kinase